MSVLDWGKVEEIREAWEGGETQSSLSVRFGVSLNTIGKIVKGQSWVNRAAVARVAGRGVVRRVEDPSDIMERMLALQAHVEARKAGAPVVSLLDGGDVESGAEGGLAKLGQIAKEMRDEGTL